MHLGAAAQQQVEDGVDRSLLALRGGDRLRQGVQRGAPRLVAGARTGAVPQECRYHRHVQGLARPAQPP